MTNEEQYTAALQRALAAQAIAREARSIANSDRVMSVYAAPEFDELNEDGQSWVAAIVEEAMERSRSTELLAELTALAEILEIDCECPPCEGSDAPAEHHLGRAKRLIAEIQQAKGFRVAYRIEHRISDTWEPGGFECDEETGERVIVTFGTRSDAEADLQLHFKTLLDAGMGFDPADWRIAQTTA